MSIRLLCTFGIAERTHVAHTRCVVLVLDHRGRFKIQYLFHLLTNVESDIFVGVVLVPDRDEVFVLADVHGDAHYIRLLEEFSNSGENHVLPHFAENRRTRVALLLHLENPATSLGETLPHRRNIRTVAE